MCGIIATFEADPGVGVVQLTELLTRHLSHRGPDGIGAAISGRAVVAHARLAIVDIAGGQQPMHAEDGRTILACNGEIYNHVQVRRSLGASHRFRSASDSEIVLHLFADLGPELLRRLDGMFAFFVTDGTRFLAARDALGIKPLYVGEDKQGGLWFASEVKALVGHCPTLFSIPPGAFVTESRRVERWFYPAWADSPGTRSDVAPDELLARLEQAVVKRLMSDVPIGVLLSGGLDSSLVAALARRHLSRLKTFSVGVEGAPDLAAARLVATALGADHNECTYSVREVSRSLDEVIYHLESYDVALVRSAIPCHFVSRMAADQVKVALTGEGADELFGGYSHTQRIRDPVALHRESVRLLRGLHSMNLQRVDRMTMAHGLEGRVPFLDTAFVDFAMSLDPLLKLRQAGGLEKALLRYAAEKVLPREIAQRPKLEFSQGSATDVILEQYAAARVTDHDMAGAAARFPIDTPKTKEELLYRSIFEELFPGEPARRTVSRWVVPSPPPMLS
jgi:asparagine synthase (glutamine-hydrolysing)